MHVYSDGVPETKLRRTGYKENNVILIILYTVRGLE